MCSACAARLPSAVATVQPSASIRAERVVVEMIGSIVITAPSSSTAVWPGASWLCTVGGSWIVRPIPCPVSSRSTRKPCRSTSASTARPISETGLPARAAAIPRCSASAAHEHSLADSSSTSATGTVIAASAMRPSSSAVTSSVTRSPASSTRSPGIPCTASSLTLMHVQPGKS